MVTLVPLSLSACNSSTISSYYSTNKRTVDVIIHELKNNVTHTVKLLFFRNFISIGFLGAFISLGPAPLPRRDTFSGATGGVISASVRVQGLAISGSPTLKLFSTISNETFNPLRLLRVPPRPLFSSAWESLPTLLRLLVLIGGGDDSSVTCSDSETFLLRFLLRFSIHTLQWYRCTYVCARTYVRTYVRTRAHRCVVRKGLIYHVLPG